MTGDVNVVAEALDITRIDTESRKVVVKYLCYYGFETVLVVWG